jgi:copper chaperone CopZ
MYCPECTGTIRDRLSKVEGVVEVLVTNYVETPYGIAQVFYDSKQVSRDQMLANLESPYWATLIEDKDPKREQLLQRYTEIYVC